MEEEKNNPITAPVAVEGDTEEVIDPESVIQGLGIKEGDQAADFGCGAGYYVMMLARQVGEDGKVWGLDLLAPRLEALQGRLKLASILNVELLVVDLEDATALEKALSGVELDWILMSDLLFMIENREALLEVAKKKLKKGGRLVIIDWNEDSGALKESAEFKLVKKEEIKSWAQKVGLAVEREMNFYGQWGLVLKKTGVELTT